MSKSWKRTEITIETESLVILRSGMDALRAWCQPCGQESLLLTPEAAAKLAGVTTSVIHARVEDGSLHFKEQPDGTLVVCARSLEMKST
jgi:hypothetical protein